MNKQIATYLERDSQIKRLKEQTDSERFEILVDKLNDIINTQSDIQDMMFDGGEREEHIEAINGALGQAIEHIEYLENKISKLTKKNKKLKKKIALLTEDEV